MKSIYLYELPDKTLYTVMPTKNGFIANLCLYHNIKVVAETFEDAHQKISDTYYKYLKKAHFVYTNWQLTSKDSEFEYWSRIDCQSTFKIQLPTTDKKRKEYFQMIEENIHYRSSL